MVGLRATQDIRKAPLWLGHNNLTTTEVYVRAAPTGKLKSIEAVVPPSLRIGKFRPPDKLLVLLGACLNGEPKGREAACSMPFCRSTLHNELFPIRQESFER